MKKFIPIFIAFLTLTACNNNENKEEMTSEIIIYSIEETSNISPETVYTEPTTSFSAITNSEKSSLNASKITSGILYDNIKKVYPDVNIYQGETAEGNILGIDLNIKKSSISEECNTYIKKSKEIIALDEFSTYNSVVISMDIDSSKNIAMITFDTEKLSTFLWTFDENYTDTLEQLYNNSFSETDILIQSDNELKKLAEEYHIK